MENITQQGDQTGVVTSSKSKYWKFTVWFVGIVVTAGVVLWAVDYFSPKARHARMAREGQEQYENLVQAYQDELRADMYGGKTPEETLQMFITALRSGDVELASKYFFVSATVDRSKWIDLLNDVKRKGYLNQMASDLEQYDTARALYGPYYLFVYKNDDGTVGLQLTMILNEAAGIWKIESL